ncbi:hypothetical protein [Bifidobacterium aerophilum]|uniref:Uncharacterized protein n=1 Tax=Bifidobacterium aerophilum TaxID=1798155 RepID=A0A6N9Z5F9_9BIFI|nr:hypothetical protein [Bifidobacterium aerophilum]NEG89838.1 hypothetical protein [Bifidobacterium aerophilum]
MKLSDPNLITGMNVSAATDPARRQTVLDADCLDAIVFDPYTPHGRIIAAMCGGTGMMAASRGDLMLLIPIKEPAEDTTPDVRDAEHRLGEERLLREKTPTQPEPEAIDPAQSQQPPTIPPRRGRRRRPMSRTEVIDGIRSRARQRIETQLQQTDVGEAAALAATQERRTRDAAFSRGGGKES